MEKLSSMVFLITKNKWLNKKFEMTNNIVFNCMALTDGELMQPLFKKMLYPYKCYVNEF